ncbi:MAG: thiamine phosphate synthase, partial [Verrucomicrobia bacterium]|nr:thiamine phosphate synthase [Verrucomicrobiota bacterium]
MKQIQDCHLYTFIDGAYLNDRQPEDVARALVDGGSDIIQLRMKNASAEEVIHVAERVHPIALAAGVPLVINDHIDA